MIMRYSYMAQKEGYLNFDEYIRQGEPQKKERAEAWRTAIGLQDVDGHRVCPNCETEYDPNK